MRSKINKQKQQKKCLHKHPKCKLFNSLKHQAFLLFSKQKKCKPKEKGNQKPNKTEQRPFGNWRPETPLILFHSCYSNKKLLLFLPLPHNCPLCWCHQVWHQKQKRTQGLFKLCRELENWRKREREWLKLIIINDWMSTEWAKSPRALKKLNQNWKSRITME